EDSGVRVITQAQLLANASDVEGNSLTASNLAITSGVGTLDDSSPVTGNYTLALTDGTSVSISYNCTDNGTTTGNPAALSVAGSASFDITPVNHAPPSFPTRRSSDLEDSGVRVITQAQLLANASDVEGNSLTASNLAITSGGGTPVDHTNDLRNYTQVLNGDTSVTISYTITDNGTTNGNPDPLSAAGS